MIIRRAIIEDSSTIAKVHIDRCRNAYFGHRFPASTNIGDVFFHSLHFKI
jgi:hypothetical protein